MKDWEIENINDFVHCYEGLFRVMDQKLLKGYYVDCYKIAEEIIDFTNKAKEKYSPEDYIKIQRGIKNGINYVKRPSIQVTVYDYDWNPDGHRILPAHNIPEELEDYFKEMLVL